MDISKKTIWEAWKFLREKNSTIPSETLDFMRDVALKELEKIELKTCPNCGSSTHEQISVFGLYIGCNSCEWFKQL